MKRLILIQNDYAGAGKTTLALSFHHYLNSYRANHHHVVLAESSDTSLDRPCIEADELTLPKFISHLDQSDLVVFEVETGLADVFYKFYERNELDVLLPELGFELVVVLPVTGEIESYEGVTIAAEMYSDSAQYLIAHTPTSSFYEDDIRHWEHSYAARVMDMFEAVDLEIPAASDALEFQLKVCHSELPEVLSTEQSDLVLTGELTKWIRKVGAQLDLVKSYLFADAFRAEIMVAPITKKRKERGTKARNSSAKEEFLAA